MQSDGITLKYSSTRIWKFGNEEHIFREKILNIQDKPYIRKWSSSCITKTSITLAIWFLESNSFFSSHLFSSPLNYMLYSKHNDFKFEDLSMLKSRSKYIRCRCFTYISVLTVVDVHSAFSFHVHLLQIHLPETKFWKLKSAFPRTHCSEYSANQCLPVKYICALFVRQLFFLSCDHEDKI